MEQTYAEKWAELVSKIYELTLETEISGICLDMISTLQEIPIEDHIKWLSAGIAAWSDREVADSISIFFSIYITEIVKWLYEDINTRYQTFVQFVAAGIASPHKMIFLNHFATIFPQYSANQHIEMNQLLAIQSPIFSYIVKLNAESLDIFQLWFVPQANTHAKEYFNDNLQLALSYFKIMNHAFFQSAITITTGNIQDELLVNAQKLLKTAIVEISKLMLNE